MESNNEQKLFRRPRAPKLDKIDLSAVHDPDDTSDLSLDTSSQIFPKLESVPLTEHRKTVLSNDTKKNYFMDKHSKNLFNLKTSARSDFIYTSFQKRSLAFSALSKNQTEQVPHPYKSLGPDPLPARKLKPSMIYEYQVKRNYYDTLFYNDTNEAEHYMAQQRAKQFCFNDFLLDFRNPETDQENFPSEKNIYISSDNYQKICKLLEAKIEKDRNEKSNNIHIQTLIPDVQPVESRKPMRQVLVEMASYLKNELSEKTGAKLKTKFVPVSKWQRINGAQTELIIYEENSKDKDKSKNLKKDGDEKQLTQRKPNEAQDTITEEEIITPAHIAIVDCLLRDGLALSLKGHFIDKLPDLKSLMNSLIYLNLSFNNFKEIPDQVLDLQKLEHFKLRSNPIRYLPEKLANLQNLKTLSLSHCLLNELESCIFDLENLVHLDVSYNKLKYIDEKIVKLNKLATLNYEGNEIEYLPCCMLKMKNLKNINLKNNYLHPLIWRKYLSNDIPNLFALSAAKFEKTFGEQSNEFNKLSDNVQNILKDNMRRCDCCEDGKIFGSGLTIIRPCVKIFGVKYVPFLFYSCSIECYNSFKKKAI